MATSTGCSEIGVMWRIWPRQSCASCPRPACLARLTQCRQQRAPQGSAWQHTQRHIDGLGRQLFPHVVMDTRVGDARQSVQASSPQPAGFAPAATARDPGVCAIALAHRLERLPVSVPCRRGRGGLACGCDPTHGSRCWGLALVPSPSFGTIGCG